MIDARARAAAKGLVAQFRDGMTTNFDLQGEWPSYSKKDRGLLAIETMLWNFYDDNHEHRLDGDHGLSEEGRRLFDRCVLFLGSSLEYRWPIDDLARGHLIGNAFHAETGDTGPITGLADCLGDSQVRRETRIPIFGDDAVWPFLDGSDYRQAVGKSASNE
jgi:hypothetical protein